MTGKKRIGRRERDLEFRQRSVELFTPGDEYFTAIGLNPFYDGFAIPSPQFRKPELVEKVQFVNSRYGQSPLGEVLVSIDNGPLSTLFISDPDLLTKVGISDLQPEQAETIKEFSKAAAVVEVVGNGIRGSGFLTLQRSIFIKGIADMYIGNQLGRLFKDLLKDHKNEDFEKIEKTIRDFVTNYGEKIGKAIGYKAEWILEELGNTFLLENLIKNGELPLAALTIANDPRTLTIILGTMAANRIIGEKPDSLGNDILTSLEAAYLEIPPTNIEDGDFITRSEFANVMDLCRDLQLGTFFTRSYFKMNALVGNKTGFPDYYQRQLALSRLPINNFGLVKLTEAASTGKLWIEQSSKGLAGRIKKAARGHIDTLMEMWKDRPSYRGTFANFTTAAKALTGYELLLETFGEGKYDAELLTEIETTALEAEDARIRVFAEASDFNVIISEILSKNPEGARLYWDGYVAGERVEHESLALDKIISQNDGVDPNSLFLSMWDRIFEKLSRKGKNVKLFMAVGYKTVIPSEKLGQENGSINAQMQIAPNDRAVMAYNWATRTLYD